MVSQSPLLPFLCLSGNLIAYVDEKAIKHKNISVKQAWHWYQNTINKSNTCWTKLFWNRLHTRVHFFFFKYQVKHAWNKQNSKKTCPHVCSLQILSLRPKILNSAFAGVVLILKPLRARLAWIEYAHPKIVLPFYQNRYFNAVAWSFKKLYPKMQFTFCQSILLGSLTFWLERRKSITGPGFTIIVVETSADFKK